MARKLTVITSNDLFNFPTQYNKSQYPGKLAMLKSCKINIQLWFYQMEKIYKHFSCLLFECMFWSYDMKEKRKLFSCFSEFTYGSNEHSVEIRMVLMVLECLVDLLWMVATLTENRRKKRKKWNKLLWCGVWFEPKTQHEIFHFCRFTVLVLICFLKKWTTHFAPNWFDILVIWET